MIDEFLTDRVSIERAPQPVAGSAGQAERVFAAVVSNVPASIQARSGSYRQREFGSIAEVLFAGYFRATQDVRVGDHVIHGTTRYEVKFVASRRGNHLETDLMKVPIA